MKPVFQTLRKQGHMSSSYIDDCYFQGQTYNECADNVDLSTYRLKHLGFFPHEEKSQVVPTQQITYFGFELNSITMTVKLTMERATNIEHKCATILAAQQVTILLLAHI